MVFPIGFMAQHNEKKVTEPTAAAVAVTPRKSLLGNNSGAGGIYQLSDHLWEDKFSPKDAHGKRISRNVYAPTCEECEEKLAELIKKMKSEIATEKAKLAQL